MQRSNPNPPFAATCPASLLPLFEYPLSAASFRSRLSFDNSVEEIKNMINVPNQAALPKAYIIVPKSTAAVAPDKDKDLRLKAAPDMAILPSKPIPHSTTMNSPNTEY